VVKPGDLRCQYPQQFAAGGINAMFAGLDNTQVAHRRGWPALISFTLQAAAVATALAIPLLYPSGLSNTLVSRHLFVPIMSPDVEPPVNPHSVAGGGGIAVHTESILVTQEHGFHFYRPGPSSVPVGSAPDLPIGPAGYSVPGLALGSGPIPILRAAAPVTRVSHPMQSYLIRRVEPIYPAMAKSVGVQGAVVIKALISTEGRIEQAQVVSGSPLLAKPALDAIQQWRYRPYLLNDKPVEVETQIIVNFVLNR
jgi:protein TonB